MLSDEEKAVLEILKGFEPDDLVECAIYLQALEKITNLIEKQSKEIEELKEKNRQGKMRIVQLENEITARIEDVNKYFTPNDKIKAKIEDIESQINDIKDNLDYEYNETMVNEVWRLENKIDVLQSLLEKE